MSININTVKILEDEILGSGYLFPVEVSNKEALAILKQNFRENIEAGAPLKLIDNMLIEINKTIEQIKEIYVDNVLRLK